jgi:hypothetical protein
VWQLSLDRCGHEICDGYELAALIEYAALNSFTTQSTLCHFAVAAAACGESISCVGFLGSPLSRLARGFYRLFHHILSSISGQMPRLVFSPCQNHCKDYESENDCGKDAFIGDRHGGLLLLPS